MKNIEKHIIRLGFTHYTAGSGCHEYIKKKDKLHSIQISGEDLTEIKSYDEPVSIGLFESEDPGKEWPYQKKYSNFKEMLAGEKNNLLK